MFSSHVVSAILFPMFIGNKVKCLLLLNTYVWGFELALCPILYSGTLCKLNTITDTKQQYINNPNKTFAATHTQVWWLPAPWWENIRGKVQTQIILELKREDKVSNSRHCNQIKWLIILFFIGDSWGLYQSSQYSGFLY